MGVKPGHKQRERATKVAEPHFIDIYSAPATTTALLVSVLITLVVSNMQLKLKLQGNICVIPVGYNPA